MMSLNMCPGQPAPIKLSSAKRAGPIQAPATDAPESCHAMIELQGFECQSRISHRLQITLHTAILGTCETVGSHTRPLVMSTTMAPIPSRQILQGRRSMICDIGVQLLICTSIFPTPPCELGFGLLSKEGSLVSFLPVGKGRAGGNHRGTTEENEQSSARNSQGTGGQIWKTARINL